MQVDTKLRFVRSNGYEENSYSLYYYFEPENLYKKK